MSFRRVSLFLSAVFLLLPACSNHTGVMPATPGAPFALAPSAKTFGAGLATTATLLYSEAEHERDYCQTKGSAYDSCPSYAMGKKTVRHAAKGSGSDATFGARVAYNQAAKSSLGFDGYDEKVSVSSKNPTLDSAAGQQHLGWEDVLHVNGNGLPNTTPVKISLELVVKQSTTKVNCKYDPTAWFDFSATGIEKTEPNVEVRASCVHGKFTYTIGDGSRKGLKDVGVLNANPGEVFNISGTGAIRLHACQLVTSCAKSYTSEIAGTVTWRITNVSPKGVTLSTDSGITYR